MTAERRTNRGDPWLDVLRHDRRTDAEVTESEDALRAALSYLDTMIERQTLTGAVAVRGLVGAALAARPSQPAPTNAHDHPADSCPACGTAQPVYEPHQGPHEFRCVECGADLSQAKAIDFPVELPTFTYSPDTCSIHGKIGDSVSIAAHLQEAHNISWAEYQNLIDAKVSAAKLVIGNRNSDMIDERIEKALDDHLKTWHDMGDP